jgi:O-antigen ligase
MPTAIAIAAACLLPTLLAYNQTPAATLYNQLLALTAWGMALLIARPAGWPGQAARWPVAAVGLLALALLLSAWRLGSLQEASTLVLLAAATAVFLLGARAASPLQGADAGTGLALGCLLAGLAGVAIGGIQVFAPALADGQWIARSGFVGRAVGNVRQPNHLATLLLMAAVGLVWLAQQRSWRPLLVWPAMALLVGGVVLSASRTGLWFGVPLLFLWGLLDGQMERRWRLLLIATPLLAALAWAGMHWWSASGLGVFGAEARLDQEGAGSPSRIKILLNAWTLLQQHPWTGVGWGGFNRAWSLSPFPDRPIAFFDHTHNLPLQLLVELGWPLGGAVLLLLLIGLGAAARLAWRARGAEALARRAPLMMVLIVGLHSLLEYPLWYAYFLLPTALAFGLALAPERAQTSGARPLQWPRLLGLLLIAGSGYALYEYRKVVAIYAPAADAAPLAQRIEAGQRTLLFGRHADYAAATSLGVDAKALAAAQRTGWQLIDARLLIAWAKHLHAAGETDKARFVVARLREFRSREGDAWLAACDTETSPPWFCAPPQRHYNWREF